MVVLLGSAAAVRLVSKSASLLLPIVLIRVLYSTSACRRCAVLTFQPWCGAVPARPR